MKNWENTRNSFVNDHLAKELVDHNIRLNALKKIEKVFSEKFPELLGDENVFQNISKIYIMKLYECFKGLRLNGAEKSVFNGLYKFCK